MSWNVWIYWPQTWEAGVLPMTLMSGKWTSFILCSLVTVTWSWVNADALLYANETWLIMFLQDNRWVDVLKREARGWFDYKKTKDRRVSFLWRRGCLWEAFAVWQVGLIIAESSGQLDCAFHVTLSQDLFTNNAAHRFKILSWL